MCLGANEFMCNVIKAKKDQGSNPSYAFILFFLVSFLFSPLFPFLN
jgi:hypothetical protein